MPAAHVFSYSVCLPCARTRERKGMGKPFGEPAATSDRALRCSRLCAGAQRHARAAFAALQPVEPHSAECYNPYAFTERAAQTSSDRSAAWRW
eukprot:5749331-Prymnesium_polylepis.2